MIFINIHQLLWNSFMDHTGYLIECSFDSSNGKIFLWFNVLSSITNKVESGIFLIFFNNYTLHHFFCHLVLNKNA